VPPVVVGAQQDQDVFDRHDEDERPQDQRKHAEHRAAGNEAAGAAGRRYRLAQRIKRARADVAVDDPDAADGERPEAGVGMRFTVSVDRNVAPAGSSYALGHWQCQKGRYVMLRCNIKRGRRL
jgi:hypothetical protein